MLEHEIKITPTVSGTLKLPENFETNSPPIYLLLHGFAMDRHEVAGFYDQLSEELIKQNYATLSVDLYLDIKDDFSTITFNEISERVDKVLLYIKTQSDFNFQSINICGFSLGATLAITALEGTICDNLILISPARDLFNDFKCFLGEKFDLVLREQDVVELDLGWKKIRIGASFLNSLKSFEPEKQFSSFNGEVLLIAGSNDFTASNVMAYKEQLTEHKISNRSQLIADADHIFNAFSDLSKIPSLLENILEFTHEHSELRLKNL